MQALHDRRDRLRAGLDLLMTERGADMAEAPGGSTGLLVRQYQGAQAMPVYKVDTGLLSLLSELRALEKQAAEELGEWTEKRERPGDGTTAPTSITVTFVTPDKTPAPPEAATS